MSENRGLEKARIELKFVAPAIRRHELEHWVRMHPALFVSPYPDRRISNVYFDNDRYDAFNENLAGTSWRTKVRYRWYGSSPLPEPGHLEIKRKRNIYGWKRRFRFDGRLEPGREAWRRFAERVREDLPLEARPWLDRNPRPVLLNRYLRRYFVSRGEPIRVTFDTEQQVWDQRSAAAASLGAPARLADTVVVEFKFARDAIDVASSLLQGFPIRVGRHSKYINGVAAISG